MSKSSGSGRTRNFASVIYPDSAPENWEDILIDLKVPAFISPLHDSDCDPFGDKKKSHYHVLLMFEGVKTIEQAENIFQQIGGVGLEKVNSLRGYARYLCHLDNPEKFQYKQEEVRSLCGADFSSIIGLATDKYKAIGEMIDYCIDHKVTSYAALLNYSRHEHMDWFRVLCDSGTIVVKEFLKSYKWSLDNDEFSRN